MSDTKPKTNTPEPAAQVQPLVRRLRGLEKVWDRKYCLFANNGTLELWEGYPADGGKLIDRFPRIFCDGGDWGHEA